MYIQAVRNIRQDVYAGQDDTRTKQKLKEASMKDINKLRHEPNEDINKDFEDINKDVRLIVMTKTRAWDL